MKFQAYIRTTDTYVELKREKPHGKLTQDCCTGNSAYHPGEPRQAPKRIPQSVEHKLVRSVVRHGLADAANRHADRLQGITGGRSNVGMRSSLARAGSSSKTSRFLAIHADTDTALDAGVPASTCKSSSRNNRAKGKGSLVAMRRANRNG